MRHRPKHAFTLIELLVVISIIALLIALLLPTLAHAREAANQVACAAHQKQMALATLVYVEDHDGVVPVGLIPGARFPYWPARILHYLNDEQIFVCPQNIAGYDGWNAYVANGGEYMFYFVGRGPSAHIDSLKTPSRIFMFRETSEDWADAQKGRTFTPGAGGGLLNGGLQMKMEYYDNVNSGHKSMGGRHFRGGGGKAPGFGGAKFDPWGFDNISFMDGHVTRYSMEQIVRQNATFKFWYEYPFVPAAAKSYFGAPPPNSSPQPGAEWWGPPYWQ